MIELYHWEPNMFSLKPLIALHEKGVPFTSRYTDFGALEQYALPVALTGRMEVEHNPERDGPILVVDGTPMTESFFITLYLDDAYPEKPLRGPDAENRWRVLMWARFINEVLEPAVSTLGSRKFLSPLLQSRNRRDIEKTIERMPTKEQRDGWTAALAGSYSDDLVEDSRRKIGLAVKKFEDALAKGPWLAGQNYSLADINAFSILRPVQYLASDLLESASRTKDWLARIESRPAVKAALAASKTGKPHEAFTPGPEHSRWG
ncbi:MAG TPA: glutathione S-transferase family protein [Rhizomicrobium sp.]|nr:glutathione S-transferase family protein [Rhizomicrobium sp.]